MKFRVVCVGASAGGVTALQNILKHLPLECGVALVVAQHFPADFEIDHSLVFGGSLKVLEVFDKMKLEPARAYFAPPGYHLQVEKDLSLSLSQDDPVNFARPSIDVLFETAAWSLGQDAIGVLLTGANADGTKGLVEIQKAGGITIVQDPKEAEADVMPRAALAAMTPDFVLSLEGIAGKITEVVGAR